MKRLGLIAGMSWESTQVYYTALNRGVRQRLGGLHSANLAMISLDFAPIANAQSRGDWETLAGLLCDAADQLVSAGAAQLMICTNTMHKVAPELQTRSPVPLLHIGDACGQALQQASCRRVALLGTRFTMAEPFYRDYLTDHFDLDVRVPDATAQDTVHHIIFDELCAGRCRTESATAIRAIISELIEDGAEAVLLGCTELGLLIPPDPNAAVPILDSTLVHVDYALDQSMTDPDRG